MIHIQCSTKQGRPFARQIVSAIGIGENMSVGVQDTINGGNEVIRGDRLIQKVVRLAANRRDRVVVADFGQERGSE